MNLIIGHTVNNIFYYQTVILRCKKWNCYGFSGLYNLHWELFCQQKLAKSTLSWGYGYIDGLMQERHNSIANYVFLALTHW